MWPVRNKTIIGLKLLTVRNKKNMLRELEIRL